MPIWILYPPCGGPGFIEDGVVPGFMEWYEKEKERVRKEWCENNKGCHSTMWHQIWEEHDSFFFNHLDMILAGDIGTPPYAFYKWVEGKEELSISNQECKLDSDCNLGFCYNGFCVTHSNPEIMSRSTITEMISPLYMLTSQYIRFLGRAEGMKCKEDKDCINPDYICKDGRCHDVGRYCRRHHIILVLDAKDESGCGIYYFLPLTYAHWMQYGLLCNDDRDCLGGAKCKTYEPNHPYLIDKICSVKDLDTNPYGFIPLSPTLKDRNRDPIKVKINTID